MDAPLMLVSRLDSNRNRSTDYCLPCFAEATRNNYFPHTFENYEIDCQILNPINCWKMVCEKCEKKLGRVITPDPWKSGARNTTESGGRKIGENKALTASKARFNPYTNKFNECRICRTKVHQVGSHYCQACAYKKGICAMCGKKILNTKNYRQSST